MVDTLLDEIRQDLNDTGIELVGEFRPQFHIGCSAGHTGFRPLTCSVYDQSPEQAYESVRQAKESALPGQGIYATVKLGFDAIRDATELIDIVSAINDAGADAVLFYNYAECAKSVLDCIRPAIKS